MMPSLRLPGRIPLRLRVFFRGAFLLLALATVALALSVLQEEKQLSLRNYQTGFAKTQAQISARLRHPTGQLALLNPGARGSAMTPLVLPFSAIDFDDKAKAQQAVEMAGCLVQYGDQASLCVAVGNNPLAGGFLYTVGSFASTELVARQLGELDLSLAHRVRVTVTMRGQTWRWLAPFESGGETAGAVRGRLTGFTETADGQTADLPERDFRGWLWQDARCLDGSRREDCPRRSFFSLRLPVALFRDDLQAARGQMVWPPADLDRITVALQVLPPGADAAPLFDSRQPGATAPFTLAELSPLLLPGETLRIRRLTASSAARSALGAASSSGAQGNPSTATTPAASAPGIDIATLTGQEDRSAPRSPLIDRLIRQLPAEGWDQPLLATERIATPAGEFEWTLAGDVRSINRSLSRVATRVAWFVGALLLAIGLTWAAIELRVIRRITVLTRRAAAVSRSMRGADGAAPAGVIAMDVADLRGSDELGLLAGTLGDLMGRVNDDVRREHIRAQQEKDQWHAVGHEIMSPLQSLMVLHAAEDDPSHRYIQRMQQAVRVLYGQASPSEAFQAASLSAQTLDLAAFLRHVAANAPDAGIANVVLAACPDGPVPVQGDDYALEDVVTHVLRNADRHRLPGSAIRLALRLQDGQAEVDIENQGPAIDDALVDRIFEYGVSDAPVQTGAAMTHRGQGLFVARTYMAKMGGTIGLRQDARGVCFVLRLKLAEPAGR